MHMVTELERKLDMIDFKDENVGRTQTEHFDRELLVYIEKCQELMDEILIKTEPLL